MTEQLHPLTAALADYYTPDPDTIQQLEKNGIELPYVGHAEITRILCEIDPEWTWEPAAWIDGRPATHLQIGKVKKKDGTVLEFPTVSMWGRLTLCGVTRTAVGSVEAHKADIDKELVSDFLRNAAMRFGICLQLWAKSTPPVGKPSEALRSTQEARSDRPRTTSTAPASDAQKRLLRSLKYAGDPEQLTKASASEEIERLKAAQIQAEFPGATEEEPF